MKRTLLTVVAVIVLVMAAPLWARDPFQTYATFGCSGAASRDDLKTQSAFAVLTNELFNGKTRALEIFFDHPLTEGDRAEIRNNQGKALRESYDAVLVLFIDKENKIWQVNATCVIPGRTVAFTIAWKPEDLKQYFSDYAFDGTILKLKSTGLYRDVDSQKNPLEMRWDVNVDMPVIDETGR